MTEAARQLCLRSAIQYGVLFGLLACALVVSSIAVAQNRLTPQPVSSGVVQTVVDGDTVRLRSGTQIRLVGLQAPKLSLGRRGFIAWPLATEAKETLARLTLGKTVSLRYTGRKSDRHGRLLAHLTTKDGTWVQGALLSDGMARVYTFPDNRARSEEMLRLESTARTAGRGIWALPYYRIRTPDELGRDIGTFQIIEGVVREAAIVRGRAYLNFGQNWRTDFTITMSPKSLRRQWREGPAVAAYHGRRVRVRGWLKSYNGPSIDATHPEQIEIIP